MKKICLLLIFSFSLVSFSSRVEAQVNILRSVQNACSSFFNRLFSRGELLNGFSKDAHPSFIELSEARKFDEIDLPEDYKHLSFAKQEIKTFKSTDETHLLYHFEKAPSTSMREYSEFLENTAEVIFYSNSRWGHIRLRVGKKLYGFENIEYSMLSKYTPTVSKNEKVGTVFWVGKDKVNNMLTEIEKFYNGSQKYNFPPFDGSGGKILVNVDDAGKVKFHSKTPPSSYGNRKFTKAVIIEENGAKYLQNPDGLKLKLNEDNNGQLWMEGFSCASSASHVLNNYLGVNVVMKPYARGFRTHIQNGNEGFDRPIAKIIYKKPE